jgi:hypothetical protein
MDGLPPTLACDPDSESMWHGVHVALPRTTIVHKGAREEEGMQKTLLRGREQSVSLSRQPFFSPRVFAVLHVTVSICGREHASQQMPHESVTQAGLGGCKQTLGIGPRDSDARDVLPTRQPSIHQQ